MDINVIEVEDSRMIIYSEIDGRKYELEKTKHELKEDKTELETKVINLERGKSGF